MDKNGKITPFRDGSSQNDMGWDDIPESVYYGLKFLYKRYKKPIVITENGTAQNDRVCLDGKVHDAYRIDHTARYLSEMKKAVDEGIPVNGRLPTISNGNADSADGSGLFLSTTIRKKELKKIPFISIRR